MAAVERRGALISEEVVWDVVQNNPTEEHGWHYGIKGENMSFGPDIVEEFNHQNNIDLICRAHQIQPEGYTTMFDGALVSIWSAPNFCNRHGNKGAILEIDENL